MCVRARLCLQLQCVWGSVTIQCMCKQYRRRGGCVLIHTRSIIINIRAQHTRHIRTHATHIYTHARNTCTHTHMRAYTNTHTHARTHTRNTRDTHTHTHVYACNCVCTHAQLYNIYACTRASARAHGCWTARLSSSSIGQSLNDQCHTRCVCCLARYCARTTPMPIINIACHA